MPISLTFSLPEENDPPDPPPPTITSTTTTTTSTSTPWLPYLLHEYATIASMQYTRYLRPASPLIHDPIFRIELAALTWLVGQRGENGVYAFISQFNDASDPTYAELRTAWQTLHPDAELEYDQLMAHLHWRVVFWNEEVEVGGVREMGGVGGIEWVNRRRREALERAVQGPPPGWRRREWVAECLGRERCGCPGWMPGGQGAVMLR